MTVELPEEPKSRKEQYLADIAGQDVTLPKEPASREEQYLAYIAENGGGGGGGSYTAGEGINIADDTISVDTTTIQPKLTAGTNITISDQNVISASGGSGPTVVQITGTSTTDVMSQNAVTSMVFADPSTKNTILIGNSSGGTSSHGVAIGHNVSEGEESVAIGENANGTSENTVSIGRGAHALGRGSVAIGSQAQMPPNSVRGTVSFYTSSTGYGYNGNSNYRLLTGLYDPQSAHDAATKGYVDGLVGNIASALNAINNGTQS